MNIFVSYTRNDGIIKTENLYLLNKFLSEKHNVFIHAVESSSRKVNQEDVIVNLIKSDVILLLFTEGCFKSNWVNLEIELSNLFDIPIVPVDATKLLFEN
ncbi:hypothetical protein [Lelliottia sp. RWM.1]|uniref:hypothetical protein n=1 Tax=Lelliottia sp. RWM.1 TaxID=2663242 RepID=UPI00193E7475|nr:hypothetical protein [Lelliottia sp. RWM.1]MBM3073999.1 hypothetical protein [Lelliottia sp. RWM.1]